MQNVKMDGPQWITHPIFADQKPLNVFHREYDLSAAMQERSLSELCETTDDLDFLSSQMKKTSAVENVPQPLEVERRTSELRKKNKPYENKHVLFRKRFKCKSCKKAVVVISADDYYKLYLNGEFVTQGPAPGYPFHYYLNEIDVTNFLCPGENIIAVHTFYQGLINRVWISGDLRQGLFFELKIDGQTAVSSDQTWKCALHEGYLSHGKIGYDTAFAETIDARAPQTGFEQIHYDDTSWLPAAKRNVVDYRLFPQPTKQLSIYPVRPQLVETDGSRIKIDWGREMAGTLYFEAEGLAGTQVIVRMGEELQDDGTVRYKMRCNCQYEDVFILSGGKDAFRPYDYKAFRYAELHLPDGCVVDSNSIQMIVRHYPYQEAVHLKSEDPAFQKIWRLCADTIRYGVQEVYVDCPTREKGQYLGDVTIAAACHALLTGDAGLYRKALENYAQSSFIDQGLMSVAPASLMQEIADYSMQFPMQLAWLYHLTHDRVFLEKMAPFAENILSYFEQFERQDGLLSGVAMKWNMVDWPENLRDGYDAPIQRPIGNVCHNVLNAFYCGMVAQIDEIRSILGQAPTGKKSKLFSAFARAFYDDRTHLFYDSESKTHASLHSNVLPLLFDIQIDEATKAAVVELIRRKRLTSCGTYFSYFVLSALIRVQEFDLCAALVKDPSAWLNMLEQGATTCFEAWGKDQKWNTSLCHPWSACPILILNELERKGKLPSCTN